MNGSIELRSDQFGPCQPSFGGAVRFKSKGVITLRFISKVQHERDGAGDDHANHEEQFPGSSVGRKV
jgi:hypothetical protein